PVYPSTEGLTQPRLRSLAAQALTWLDHHAFKELLPEAVRRQRQQLSLAEAVRYLHQPPQNADLEQLLEGEHPFQARLAFEELLAHHLSLLLLRRQAQADGAVPLKVNPCIKKQFLHHLGFTLTAAQQRVDRSEERRVGKERGSEGL